MISHAVSRAELGKMVFAYACIAILIIVAVVGYYWPYVEQQELQAANKCEKINFVLHFVTVLFL